MSDASPITEMREPPIVIFDGECAFCHRGVRFIIRHEAAARLRFTPRQSPSGQALLARHNLLENRPDSMVLIEHGRAFIRSEGVLRIAAHLRAPWRWLAAMRLVPRFLRDPVYKLIARNRHRFSRTAEACIVPGPELEARLLRED